MNAARGASFAADQEEGPQRGSGRPIPPLVSKIQVATTNTGSRAQGGLTPDFLALSDWIHLAQCNLVLCPIVKLGAPNTHLDAPNGRGYHAAL